MNALLCGAIAGAAGTLALDVSTYSDMALRGRQSSNMPAEVVRRMAERAGIESLARPDERSDNETKARRSALGALCGYAVGLGIGTVYGALRPRLKGIPGPLMGLVLGAAAMAASDVPAAKLGATDLSQWGVSGWLSDAIPHAIFGLVTAGVADAVSS
ncbi:MAG: hypothetical protein M3R51_01985 [Candidatus Eremiobacteraeota bacterium]|nr:hypothetical protein [Candidatus Eremiobacteraeota bacterium]